MLYVDCIPISPFFRKLFSRADKPTKLIGLQPLPNPISKPSPRSRILSSASQAASKLTDTHDQEPQLDNLGLCIV